MYISRRDVCNIYRGWRGSCCGIEFLTELYLPLLFSSFSLNIGSDSSVSWRVIYILHYVHHFQLNMIIIINLPREGCCGEKNEWTKLLCKWKGFDSLAFQKRFRSQGVGSCHVTSCARNAESSHVTFGGGICRNSRKEAEVDAVGKMKHNF